MSSSALPEAFSAVRSANIGICLTDASLRYLWINPAYARFLGYSEADLLGHSPFEFTHPDDIHLDRELSEQLLRGEIPHYQTRKRFIRPDGSITVGDLVATALFDDSGIPTTGVAIVLDAAASDPAAKRIESLQRSAAIGQVTASAVHDLRNSLAAIGLVSDSLQAQYGSVPAVELLKYEVEGTMSLLKAIMSYARPAVPNPSYDPIDTVLAQANPLLRLVVPATMALDITVTTSGLTATIAARELQQVITNLVLNARDATPAGGRISITTATAADDDSYADIIVSDNGIGMTPSQLERAFDPYFTTKGDAGTGLGLAICRDIVERNGGQLLAESTAGSGSSFTVRLPLVPRAALSDRREREVASEPAVS